MQIKRIEYSDDERVETGPIQFGDDWPGVFIRGDNAFGYTLALESLLRSASDDDVFSRSTVQGLLDVLKSCNLNSR